MDLGDGFKAMSMNLTLRRERLRHCYKSPGVYRVAVRAENVAGRDEAVLFVQVNCESPRPRDPESLPVTERTRAWGDGGEPLRSTHPVLRT